VILRYVWGFTESEIGHCLGVTESRVCQVLKGIHENLQTALLKGEAKGSGLQERRKCEMASLVKEEIIIVPVVELPENFCVAKEESRKMESFNEEGYSQWLI
jgi:predicted transcriptional regulator